MFEATLNDMMPIINIDEMTPFYIEDKWYWLLIGAVVCYLLGCFHFAKVIVKIKHADLGAGGNPGAMNVSRRLGLKFGLLNFFCDALKGVVPVLVGYFAFNKYYFAGTQVLVRDFIRLFFALFAVLGHIFPVFHKFKGGKGISTTIGILWASIACEQWWSVFLGLALFVALFVYAYFTEWGSMGSLLGVAAFTVWQAIIFLLRYTDIISDPYVVCMFLMLLALNLLTWIAHNKNLFRLMAGEEHRTSLKRMLGKKKRADKN